MAAVHAKKGITFKGVKPEIAVAIPIAATVVESLGGRFVITSLSGGEDWRSPRSLHPRGYAFDIRIWDFPSLESQRNLVRALQDALGDEFDVVLESDHIHIEFDSDPKPDVSTV